MVSRHVGQEVDGGVGIDQIVHVPAEEVAGVEQTAEGDESVEQVRPPEEGVGRVDPAHAAARGHGLFAPFDVLGHQLLRHVVEPALLLLGPIAAVAAFVGPALLVDAVHQQYPELPRLDPGADGLHHAEVAKVPGVAVLGREGQAELSGVADECVLHVPVQIVTVGFEILLLHSRSFTPIPERMK